MAAAPLPTAAQATDRDDGPKLLVLVVVDQLRGDLIDRYEQVWTGGIKRLVEGGMVYTAATHDHALTATAPGHATLATGVYPARHGIVGNSWIAAENGQYVSVYAVRDRDAQILGDRSMEGRSPANFNASGLADWVKRADPDARVVSLSRKDRAAIGLAAQAKGEVYWIHPTKGEFITSEFYHDRYPDWIDRFNKEVMPEIYADRVWESRVPERFRALSRPDTSQFEGSGGDSYFPHKADNGAGRLDREAYNLWRYTTPLPDRAVLEAAATAVRDLELGQRRPVDFLGISLSQTDAIGHAFGPLSREQLDNLMRLDEHLGLFLDVLDAEVGAGNWVMAFSSDHGTLAVPEYLPIPGTRLDPDRQQAIYAPVQQLLARRGTIPVYQLPDSIEAILESYPEVADAFTYQDLEQDNPADSFAVLYARSHSRTRLTGPLSRFQIQIRWVSDLLPTPPPTGTTHLSPYYYDRWVPLIFYGRGVHVGKTDAAASTVDVAPTLASLAGIFVPANLDGRPLFEGW
jgi:predicted AlkP superfamily pyrophosphatase or phosphodiesterase